MPDEPNTHRRDDRSTEDDRERRLRQIAARRHSREPLHHDFEIAIDQRQVGSRLIRRTETPIVHFVGSIPLPDAETVFRRLAQTTGPYLQRLPDGETGLRKTWIAILARKPVRARRLSR
jgi:hypothetical protein